MRTTSVLRRVLPALLLIAALLPGSPARAEDTIVFETYYVPTVDGAEIAVEVMRDTRFDDAHGLAAIVPIVGISRWYGYAYGNGVRYFLNSEHPTDEGFDTPLAFDFGIVRTPATDPSDPAFFDKVLSRTNPCDSVEHTEHGYDRSPDYNRFWLERDYRKDAANFRVPVLVAHGWQDYNVKQEEGVGLYEAIPVAKAACRSSACTSIRPSTRARPATGGRDCSTGSSPTPSWGPTTASTERSR